MGANINYSLHPQCSCFFGVFSGGISVVARLAYRSINRLTACPMPIICYFGIETSFSLTLRVIKITITGVRLALYTLCKSYLSCFGMTKLIKFSNSKVCHDSQSTLVNVVSIIAGLVIHCQFALTLLFL